MCLETNTNKIQIAEQDIVVYKMVELTVKENCLGDYAKQWAKSDYQEFYVISPYQYATVNKTQFIGESLVLIPNRPNIWLVKKGFHSFVFLDRCVSESDMWNNFVTKWIIPKGSEFVLGLSVNGDIVSNNLNFVSFEFPETLRDFEKKRHVIENKKLIWGK
jgi:hypothetical protein